MTPNDTTPTAERQPVASIFVEEAIDCARKAGVDIHQALAKTGINPNQLNELDTVQFGKLWLELSFLMNDEFFGLGAFPMRPGSTVMLGHAICGATRFETALRRALRFLKIVLVEPYGEISVDGDDCILRLIETGPANTPFAYRTFFLILHAFNCWAARERIPIKKIQFRCNEPAGQNDYGDFFGVPVEFDAPHSALVFDQRYLARKMRRSEAELKPFLRSLPEAFLRGYRDAASLRYRIVSQCLDGPAADWPDAGQVAIALGMSRSTLHRRLNETGLSLNQLKEEKRQRLTIKLLDDGEMTLSQIAHHVGYNEESSFYRAFSRWFGMSPTQYRLEHLG